LEKAASSVFLIMPRLVTITTDLPSMKSRTGRTAATRSPAEIWIRFTMAFPLAARPAWGI